MKMQLQTQNNDRLERIIDRLEFEMGKRRFEFKLSLTPNKMEFDENLTGAMLGCIEKLINRYYEHFQKEEELLLKVSIDCNNKEGNFLNKTIVEKNVKFLNNEGIFDELKENIEKKLDLINEINIVKEITVKISL